MSHTQDTISWKIETTIDLPKTFTAATDLQTVEHCIHAYYRVAHSAMQYNGDLFPCDTLIALAEALMDGGAVTTLYSHDGETTARTLFPSAVTLTKDNHLICRAYCTLRRETKSFRLDRMTGAHLLTAPGDTMAEAA